MNYKNNTFRASAENFAKILGSPIAYWASEKMIKAFETCETISHYAEPRVGMATANNEKFIRLWYEVSNSQIGLNCRNRNEAVDSQKKWFPFAKGGEMRRWYGNHDYLVNWQNDGHEIRNFADPKTGRIRSHNYNLDYIFQSAITWGTIASGVPSFRKCPIGFLYSNSGYGMFFEEKEILDFLLALCNSKVAEYILGLLAPGIGIESGYIRKIPVVVSGQDTIESNVSELISLSRADWDEYEISWDFKVNPLVREGWQRGTGGMTLESAWGAVFARRIELTERMKILEEENNSLLIEAYGLHDELSPDVEWKDVSITGNPAYRYKSVNDPRAGEELARADAMRELISYGMGILMGRYSLEQEGLILASQGETYQDYLARVHGVDKIRPDDDGIIPAIALDGDFFPDNLLHRMREFFSAAFGNDALPGNLNFIEAALDCKIDKYLTERFFDDHVKTYSKRPIYWLFESPKGYFRVFAYMHRMTGATAGLIRNKYLLPYIAHLEKCHASESAKGSAMTAYERKRVKEIEKAIADCKKYDLALHDIAGRSIAIDLDDGVVVNWEKYKSVLSRI